MPPATSPELRAFIAQAPVHRGAIVERVRAAAARIEPGSRVLDAGAGDAPYRMLFAHCDYVTQDWPGSVHAGSVEADIVADLHALPTDVGTFDYVVCTEVLEHVAKPDQVLRELARVLRPGGGLLVTVPFVGALHEEPYDYWRPTSHAMRLLFEDAGFDDVDVEPLSGWWGTLGHLLRFQGLATQPLSGRRGFVSRLVSVLLLGISLPVSRLSPMLDRFDSRRALPVGWCCRGTRR